MLRSAAGIDIRHVPYRGSGPALLDLIAGTLPSWWWICSGIAADPRGKVRVLGVTTPRRVTAAPDIPTLARAGSPASSLSLAGRRCAGGTPRPSSMNWWDRSESLSPTPRCANGSPRCAGADRRVHAESFAGYIKTEADAGQRSSEARVLNRNSPPV